VHIVLQLLRTNHLKFKEWKSSFVQTYVSYLGFFIDHKYLRTDAYKV
jgi:hypothetical protein